MKYPRIIIWPHLPLALTLIFVLVGCQAQATPLVTPSAAPPSSTPMATAGAYGATINMREMVINQDPPRSASFNLNTLVYELPGMDNVEVLNITYAHHGDQPLTMDVYYPPGTQPDDRLPVVIFGLGYKMSEEALRNSHFYTSWGRLVAAAGMVGITYDTDQPDQDLELLVDFIRARADELQIDPANIGFLSSSANPPTVMSYLMQEGREGFQFSVYYYGISLTPDHKYTEEFERSCVSRGCLIEDLEDISFVDPDLPLLVVQAGKDFVPKINEAMDHFIDYVREEGGHVAVIEYAEGRHGFDTEQETEEAAEIIAQTIEFMLENFGVK